MVSPWLPAVLLILLATSTSTAARSRQLGNLLEATAAGAVGHALPRWLLSLRARFLLSEKDDIEELIQVGDKMSWAEDSATS